MQLENGAVLEGDEILVGVGRRPVDGRPRPGDDRPRAGQATSTVDDTLRVPGHDWLYAIGDVNGRVLLTHMGKYQGRIAADDILGKDAHIDRAERRRALAARHVHRAAGRGGRPHARVRAGGGPARARGRHRRRRAPRAAASTGATRPGTSRLVVDEKRRVIVGATFCGTDVAEWLHAATFAVVGEVPIDKLWHAVPSLPHAQRGVAAPLRDVRPLEPARRAERRTSPPTARREKPRCSRGRAERARGRGASAPVRGQGAAAARRGEAASRRTRKPSRGRRRRRCDRRRGAFRLPRGGARRSCRCPCASRPPAASALRGESKGGPTPGPPTPRTLRASPSQNDQG